MDIREEKLVNAVEALSAEIVAFTSRLIAQGSTLGSEAPVLKVMENELNRLGYAPARIAIDPGSLSSQPGFAPVPWSYEGRYNVVATRPADAARGKSA
ncbi:MAG: hypothetical protein WBN03_21055, partial [Desulfobacterales bacterium]